MSWYAKSQVNIIEESIPYFKEIEEMGDYVPDVNSIEQTLTNRVGSTVSKVIGSGDSGVAYLLTNGDVLKITTNSKEGIIAIYLMHNPHPNIVSYKDVWKEGDLYYIVMEHVDSIDTAPLLKKLFQTLSALMDIKKCYDPKCAYHILKQIDDSSNTKEKILDYLLHLSDMPTGAHIFDFLSTNNVGVLNGDIKFFDIN